jgi:DNA-binding NarL/FixJ family response regulator
MKKIRVLLVDDHAVLRAGLRMLINAQADMEVVGEASNATEALEAARRLLPDVVTLDLSMPGEGGLKFIEEARATGLEARVVVLTMHDDPAYFRTAVGGGATGYVVKSAADSELLTAIRAVHEGRLFVSMPSGKSEGIWPSQLLAEPPNPLSEREQQVLLFLAEGFTNKEIGERLDLSVKTIETYRARIASKLQLRTRADIVRYALDMGLLRQESADTKPA